MMLICLSKEEKIKKRKYLSQLEDIVGQPKRTFRLVAATSTKLKNEYHMQEKHLISQTGAKDLNNILEGDRR